VRLRLEAAIDCASRYARAWLYTSKLPLHAVQLLNKDVLPTFEQRGAAIEAVLSDMASSSAVARISIPMSSSCTSKTLRTSYQGRPVEQSAGEPLGGEHAGPLAERQVAGDDRGATLVALARYLAR
jgi:hypothetical protein